MDVRERSVVHSALGDEGRLRLVDLLVAGDLTVQELAVELRMPGNLLAHHLNVLEGAGIIERRESEGDRRRRYVTIRRRTLDGLMRLGDRPAGPIVFVCSHNSARSQFAAAYWHARTGEPATSAGSDPASMVHPTAVRVARERGLDLSAASPHGYDSIVEIPATLVSVCDRAREGSLPDAERLLHWSIPDPVPAVKVTAFRSAFEEIERRINDLTGAK
jgi:protein-tyrosine-phosphatase